MEEPVSIVVFAARPAGSITFRTADWTLCMLGQLAADENLLFNKDDFFVHGRFVMWRSVRLHLTQSVTAIITA